MDKRRGRASEEQKRPLSGGGIDQNPKNGKELWKPLNLVDDTNPERDSRTVMGADNLARSAGFSRSK